MLWEYVRKRKISYRFDILDELTVTSRCLNFLVTWKNLFEVDKKKFRSKLQRGFWQFAIISKTRILESLVALLAVASLNKTGSIAFK